MLLSTPILRVLPAVCARCLRLLWAAPLTLFGLLLAFPILAAGGRLRVLHGHASALLADGPLADWLLQRHPLGPMSAMAVGHVVIAAPAGLLPRVLTHELEHVRQAERWGPLFPLLYAGSSAWQWLRGRHLYRDNRFEAAARSAEKTVRCKPQIGGRRRQA